MKELKKNTTGRENKNGPEKGFVFLDRFLTVWILLAMIRGLNIVFLPRLCKCDFFVKFASNYRHLLLKT